MPRRCVIVEDEVMICDLISDIAAVAGWTPRHCRSASDLEARLDPMPDLVFLDIGLQQSDALDAIDILAARQFAGTVQIVSGQDRSVMEEVFAAGFRQGLIMADPIAKPFVDSDIRTALEGQRSTSTRRQRPALFSMAKPTWTTWRNPRTGHVSHFDCAVTELPSASQLAQIAGEVPVPAATIGGRPATWAVALPVTVRNAVAVAATGAAALTRLTCAFGEDDVFSDVDRSRAVFAQLRDQGVTVRIDGCSVRTFAVSGHAPLGIDEMVVRDFLGGQACAGAAERKMRTIAEIAHRSDARLMAAAVMPSVADAALARSGFDMVQRDEKQFEPLRFDAARRAYQPQAWRRVSLDELGARRRYA